MAESEGQLGQQVEGARKKAPQQRDFSEIEILAARLALVEKRIELLDRAALPDRAPLQAPSSNWITNLLQGVTLLAIISFAFWLGSLSNKLDASTVKVDKLNSLILESRDGLMPHVSAIDAKVDAINKKLDELAKKDEKGE